MGGGGLLLSANTSLFCFIYIYCTIYVIKLASVLRYGIKIYIYRVFSVSFGGKDELKLTRKQIFYNAVIMTMKMCGSSPFFNATRKSFLKEK